MTRLSDPTNAKVIRKKAKDRQYISTCPLCRAGIFNIDERTWGRGWYLGWCHTPCVEGLPEVQRARLHTELLVERFGGAA